MCMNPNGKDTWAKYANTDHSCMWLKKTTYNWVHMCLVF